MDCLQITKADAALRIVQNPADERLQQLFSCIYRLFQAGFLNWIGKRFASIADKQTLREDAKDAFQNGLLAFYARAQQKDFVLRSSLKTVLYSFGWLQLMAAFKKQKKAGGRAAYLQGFGLFFQDIEFDAEQQAALNQKELKLLQALSSLTPRMRQILMLKFFEKLKSKEIALRIGISAGSVDNETSKAFKQLRQILTENVVKER